MLEKMEKNYQEVKQSINLLSQHIEISEIILDEATKKLDSITEKNILNGDWSHETINCNIYKIFHRFEKKIMCDKSKF